ncbi:hypothetical protein ACSQ67_003286 [Phaseolus vulgaris]
MFLIDIRWSEEDGILAPTVRSRRLDGVSGSVAMWKRRRLREGWPDFLNKVPRVPKSLRRSPPLPNWASP